MKKVLAIVLVVTMVFAMVGCGKSGKSDTVKIGGIGPLTGSYANYGVSVYQGAQIAVEEINAAGGINGKQIELQFEDSQGDPESAVNAYGKLMDWGMDVSLGGTFSGETASIVAAAKEDDVMLITPSGSADAAIEGNDKAFRVCFFDSYQGTAAADYIQAKGMTSAVGVFYESDYDYSVGLYNAFAARCQELGVEIKDVQTFTTGTNTDFAAQINALVAAKVEVVFMPIYAEEASTFLTQAKGKFGDNVYFFGADGLDGILGKVEQDVTIANNVLMLTPFAANDTRDIVVNFVSKYESKFGATPDQFAADGYDAVYVIKAAAEKAKSTSGEKMTEAMLSLSYEGTTGQMTWGADGNTSKPASAILYMNGEGSLF